MTNRVTAFIAALWLSLSAIPAIADSGEFKLEGWREVLISTRDIDTWRDFLQQQGGWTVRQEGSIDKAQLTAWGLDKGVSGEQVLLGNAGTETGFIRLLKLDGAGQRRIRSNDQSWDTGGIFDINMRVTDMERTFAQLQALGWQAPSDPVEFQFGKFHVKEWIVASPDGVRIAMIERLAPTLEGWPHLKKFSRSFNSTQTVSDMEVSLRFYRDVLGMQTYMEHRGASREAGPNVLGLPHNLATQIERQVYILHPDGINEGSVELLSFEGATGWDFSEGAWLPNLGIAGLRFPVRNIEALRDHLRAVNYPVEGAIREVAIPPYGRCKTLMVVAPGGTRNEFMECAD